MAKDVELPEGAVETHRITMVAYLNSEGKARYTVVTDGDAPLTSVMGLLGAAQYKVMSDSKVIE